MLAALLELLQLQQAAFCRLPEASAPVPGTAVVRFSRQGSMLAYAAGDIVSGYLTAKPKWCWPFASWGWEQYEIKQVLWALRQYKPQQQQQQQQQQQRGQGQQSRAAAGPLLVDVGANIGTFTFHAAAVGARVAAFEAMPQNMELLRHSLCLNPWLIDQVALFGIGLGTQTSRCHIINGSGNNGDGHTVCDKDLAKVLEGHHACGETMEVRQRDLYLLTMCAWVDGSEAAGHTAVRRCAFKQADADMYIMVLKIDVEGFELQVLQGAEGLLQRHVVRYILAECNTGIVGRDSQIQYLQWFDSHGYRVSGRSFRGPFVHKKDIQAGSAKLDALNLYAVLMD
uniref:Methyltransferase FkbM domain-containing protein n=1 Tax=Tetradesmus obliquus TaxID=3088 RepID=A0A383VZ11_TETOB